MKQNLTRKKIILGVVLVGAIAFAGMHSAGARPWGGGPCGKGPPCDESGYGYGYQERQPLDEKAIEARDKFFKDTFALRKEMASKNAELKALMYNDNPDAKRIGQLTGELFDLREQLRTKGQEAGLEGPGMRGSGLGCGCNGPGYSGSQKPL